MLAKKFLVLCTSLGLCLAFVFMVHVGHQSKNRKNKNLKECFFFLVVSVLHVQQYSSPVTHGTGRDTKIM